MRLDIAENSPIMMQIYKNDMGEKHIEKLQTLNNFPFFSKTSWGT